MRIIIVYIVLLFCIMNTTQGQFLKSIGIKGGINSTKLYASNWDADLQFKTGMQFGIIAGFKVTERLTFGVELLSFGKNRELLC